MEVKTLLGITVGVLAAAAAAATLGNAPTSLASARPMMEIAQTTSTPSPPPSPEPPADRPTYKNPYGVMRFGGVLNLVAAAPLNEWRLVDGLASANSSGYLNAVRRDAVGRSTVWFPGLDPAGAVLVTATGTAHPAAYCKSVDVRPSPVGYPGMDVRVACFDTAGGPLDTTYAVTYSRPGPKMAGGGAWVRGDEQYNSTGGGNITTRVGMGTYVVRLPGLGGAGGHVQAGAHGESNAWCKADRWYVNGQDQMVVLKCFLPNGAPADTGFTMVFARDTDATLISNHASALYTWANDPSGSNYAPPAATTFVTSAGVVTVERSAQGRYRLRTSLDISGGTVHVTAQGTDEVRCHVLGWNNTDGIQVRCARPDGSAADAPFLLAYVS